MMMTSHLTWIDITLLLVGAYGFGLLVENLIAKRRIKRLEERLSEKQKLEEIWETINGRSSKQQDDVE